MAKGPPRPTEDAIARIIDAIYAAAIAPERWTEVLAQLREMFGTAFAGFIMRNADRTQVDGIAVGLDRDDYRGFLDKFYRGSIFAARTEKWYAGEIIPTSTIVPPKLLERSPMFQEYLKPRDLHEGLRLGLSLDGAGVYHFISLMRPWSAGTYSEHELALARVLMPHLQRAVEISQRLRQADVLASAALATLDVLRHPVLLLDHDGRVLHANATGNTLLASADGLGATLGILQAATPALTNRLHAVLARAAGAGGKPAQANALRLPKRSGGAPLAMLVMPFRHEAHWSLSRKPAILVCVTDPQAVAALPARQLMDLFGLTGSEAALAADLLAGQELREIARHRGRSINTVRTHLARVMAKTNVNRQSELMRLLASLPHPEYRN